MQNPTQAEVGSMPKYKRLLPSQTENYVSSADPLTRYVVPYGVDVGVVSPGAIRADNDTSAIIQFVETQAQPPHQLLFAFRRQAETGGLKLLVRRDTRLAPVYVYNPNPNAETQLVELDTTMIGQEVKLEYPKGSEPQIVTAANCRNGLMLGVTVRDYSQEQGALSLHLIYSTELTAKIKEVPSFKTAVIKR